MKATTKFITTLMAASVLGGTVTGMVLTGGDAALAAGRGLGSAPRAVAAPTDHTLGLFTLIHNGTLTHAQARAIETAMIKQMSTNGFRNDFSDMMLSNGRAVRFMTTVLGQLITNGTVTRAQAEAVADSMNLRGMMDYGYANGSAGTGYAMMGDAYGNGSATGGYGMRPDGGGGGATASGYGMMGGF